MIQVDSGQAKESLFFAVPYLLFVAIPVYDAITTPDFSWREITILILLAVMVAIYLSIWVINPVAPVGTRPSRIFMIQISLFILVLATLLIVGARQHPGLLFMPTYLLTAWMLLAPSRLVLPGAIIVTGTTLVTGVLAKAPFFLLFMAILVIVMSASVWMSRYSIDNSRKRDFRKEQEHQLQFERERAQMNSDLHDLLGQDLTGLSIKADLADRLLEAGRVDEARAELRDLARLSRQSLEDVRAVVKKGREWSLDRELASAADLLAARDIRLHLKGTAIALPGPQAGVLARTIRESVTNLLHHSEPQNCWITVTPERLVIENDGYSSARSRLSNGSGQGLPGLRDAAASFGTLTWGPGGRGWQVMLELEP